MPKFTGVVEGVEAPKARKQISSLQKQMNEFAAQIISNPGKVFRVECEGTDKTADDYESDRSVKVQLFHAIVSRGQIAKSRLKSWTDEKTDRIVYVTVKPEAAVVEEAEKIAEKAAGSKG